jgi:hypothetical protein
MRAGLRQGTPREVEGDITGKKHAYSGRFLMASAAALAFAVLFVLWLGLSLRAVKNSTTTSAAVPLATPSGQVDSAQAGALCSAAATPDHSRVIAAYDTTEAQALAMDSASGHVSRPIGTNNNPSQPVVVCYLDRTDGTEFPIPHPPNGLQYTRERLTLTLDGHQYQPAYGSASNLPAVRP